MPAQDRYALIQNDVEAVLHARISRSCGFGNRPLGEIGAIGQIRCFVESIIGGFSEQRLIEIAPSLAERLRQDDGFPYDLATDAEIDAIGANLSQCYELSADRTITEAVAELTRDIVEISLRKERRQSPRKRRFDVRYCSRCQIPRLSLDIEEDLRQWAPQFLGRYASTIRHALNASVDARALVRLAFDDESDQDVKVLCLLSIDDRERAIRLALSAGVLRSAKDARRTDVVQDALRIADNVDLTPFVETRHALARFMADEDDPVFEAALDEAFAACGHCQMYEPRGNSRGGIKFKAHRRDRPVFPRERQERPQ